MSDKAASPAVDPSHLIEQASAGPRRIGLVALCLLVVCFDGFNAQVMGYAAPAIVKAFHVERAALGSAASAGLFGLMLGALMLGTLGDRLGRRLVIVASCAIFGLFSLLTSLAHDITTLAILRFLTGIGLGGAMPAAIALVAEYMPARNRGTAVTITVSGFAIGPAIGGFVAPTLLASGGWPALFIAGGVVPLALAPLLALLLPESTRTLLARGASADRVAANLRRVLPVAVVPAGVAFADAAVLPGKVPVRAIFADGRLLGTLCLWIAIFTNLLGLNLQTNWLPLLLTDAGYPAAQAVKVTALFHLGGALGGLALSRVLDRFDYTIAVPLAMLAAALAVATIGSVGTGHALLGAAIFTGGLFVVGTQAVLNALSGMFYPAQMRSTGAGWALGMGRLGAAVGPIVGSALAGLALQPRQLFYLEAVPFVIGAAAIAAVRFHRPRAACPAAATALAGGLPE